MEIVFWLVLGTAMALLAGRKGYTPGLWFFAWGIFGLLILAFLPFVNRKSDLPRHERRSKKRIGDAIGAALSAANVIWFVIQAVRK